MLHTLLARLGLRARRALLGPHAAESVPSAAAWAGWHPWLPPCLAPALLIPPLKHAQIIPVLETQTPKVNKHHN